MVKTCLVDTPIKSRSDDQLDISQYLDAVKEFLFNADTPLTVAIQGEWGSGKTSFMNQLSEELCLDKFNEDTWTLTNKKQEAPYFSIWIHAWEYALLKEPNEVLVSLMNGLISEIQSEVKKITPDNTDVNKYSRLALNITKKLAMATCYAAATHIGISTATLDKTLTDKEEDNEQPSIGDLKKALKYTIEASLAASPQKTGFIFFIDDLDRLDPVIAVNFLELVKNLFDLPSCIFILAIDYEVVVRGLTPRFGERTEKNEREFRSFFDKIIQVPINVPTANYDLINYLETSLERIGFLSKEEKILPIPLDRSRLMVNVYESDYSSHVRTASELIVALTECSTGNNPRSIKRLVNVLCLLNRIQDKKRTHYKTPLTNVALVTEKVILYALVCLQVAYPSIYEYLGANPNFIGWTEDEAVERGYKRLTEDERTLLENRRAFDEEFEEVIYQLARNDSYLKARCYYISRIFNILRGVILFSDHKTYYETADIEHIDLLEKYDITMLYDAMEDDPEETLIPEELQENLGYLMDSIVWNVLEYFLSVSSMTSTDSVLDRTPADIAAPRQKREYNKAESFASYEEYAEGAGEQFLELLGQLEELLGETFPEMLEYEYKDDIKKTINIRPINKKKKKGSPVLLSITMLKNKGLSMRVECSGFFKRDLSDSIEPLLEHMDDIVERFHELSTDVLEDAE